MSNQQMNPQALAEFTRRVAREGQEFDEVSEARREDLAIRAGAAIAIAERAHSGMTMTQEGRGNHDVRGHPRFTAHH
ncbi:hypothetical protein [Glutamicibacter sp. NPDC087344]|uniref:hypothetical protein n=1 Tax=Glutamicibacter sp. NPDC087344 TaxID=3363994 RepID=UPI003815BE69